MLPERFKTNIDPSITIAEPVKENLPIQVGGQKVYPTMKKGPFLYIAYCDPNPWANETSHFSPYGCLIVIRLETFFEIATTNQDLWPTVFMGSDFKPVTELVQVGIPDDRTTTQVEVTVGFTGTQLWWPFCGPYYLKHVILKSCENKVVLGWTSTTHLYIKNNPIFYSTDTNLWTDYAEYFDITRLSTRKPDIYLREVGSGVIGYCDQDGRISFIDFLSQGSDNQYEKHRLAHLLDTSASGVSLHYVTDKKGNKNIILGWFDNNNVMHHRLLFLLENPRDKSNLPV